MKKERKYKSDFPHRLYIYFTSYTESVGAPSFSKFARSIGVTTEDIEAFRARKEFERAYKECCEIRRDYLIDGALSKRFDSSTVKFLLAEEFSFGGKDEKEDTELEFTLRVLNDG